MPSKMRALVLVGLFALLLPAQPTHAAALTVNATTPYAVADGACSLIEAIDNANDDAATHADCPAGAGADVITLTADVLLDGTATFVLNGATGLPPITSEITIEGDGFSIQRDPGAPSFRILAIDAAGDLTLNRVTISNGLLDTGFVEGGGIYTAGTLTMTESVVQNSVVSGIFPSGGGISGEQTSIMTLTNTIVQNNVANNDDVAAVFDNGGGIYTLGALNLFNATIQNNTAGELGGGIYAAGATVIDNSLIANNTAQDAGGLLSFGTLAPTPFTITNTVFSGNVAIGGGDGGGAMLNGRDGITITGSQFINNTLQGAGVGGAIANLIGEMTITASIFEGNRTLDGSFGGGAISNLQLGEVNLRESIVRNNSTTARGGGLFTQLAEFNVFDSLIDSNTATLGGGGIYAAPSNVPAFTVQRSTISNNFTENFGGGFLAEGALSPSTFINSTFTGNRATTLGGGIGLNQGGVVNLIHTTIAENDTTQFNNGTGGANLFAGTGTLNGTIIANNPTGDCSATNGSTSLGFNVSTSPDGGFPPDRWCAFIPLDPTDLPDTDPLLAPIASNGNNGVSYTLQPGSPAIDIVPADCPPELNGVDQLGVPRPAGSCDAGSISSDDVTLPLVYINTPDFAVPEENPGGIRTVDIVIDNTAGTFNTPTTIPLTVHVLQSGNAADGADYVDVTATPLSFVFDAVDFPAPGTTITLQVSYDVLDDVIPESDETASLQLIVTGPGILDNTRSTHTLTIIDNDAPPVVLGNPPPAQDDMGGAAQPIAAQTSALSGAITKIGFLQDADTIEWVITAANTGATAADVVITDSVPAGLTIDSVTTSDGTVAIAGQTVTVNVDALAAGTSVQVTLITTSQTGIAIVANTACIQTVNGERCATALPVSTLPATGETPLWRTWLLGVMYAGVLLQILRFTIFVRHPGVAPRD